MNASSEPPSPQPDQPQLADPVRPAPRGELPPVEPPTMGFILQLFVIPLVIVTIIVLVWLLFNWLAHMGSNPTELVADLKKLNDSSWQKALTLADLLRSSQYSHLKQDAKLAAELGQVLDGQIEEARMDENSIRLRVFLCRALGEFQTPNVLPFLLRAAQTERQAAETEVRLGALQSLAVYIATNRTETLQHNAELNAVLQDISREQPDGGDQQRTRGELRSHAAFALGVLGGQEALQRLTTMSSDAYPNARYNAATGLCRHGDLRALPVLLEMLEPDNVEAVRDESAEEARPWKRLVVIQNGLRAAGQLVEKNPSADLSQLAAALDEIIQSDLAQFEPDVRRGIRIAAEEVRIHLKARRTEPGAVSGPAAADTPESKPVGR